MAGEKREMTEKQKENRREKQKRETKKEKERKRKKKLHSALFCVAVIPPLPFAAI
jgi:hypothetical protein